MEPQGPARVERRLAAILAADVAGYSRLIEADEEGTLSRLKALRAEILDPKIAEHHGRIVKTTGDGLLVEFASVVDALRCAAEIQAAMAESNAPLPADKRIASHQYGRHRRRGRIASPENVLKTSSVASPPVFPLPH
jgi:class 3 adenylate cyclase